MRAVQRGGDLQRDPADLGPWHRTIFLAPILERSAVAILHRIVKHPVVQRAVVDHRDAGMVELADSAGLSQKPLGFLLAPPAVVHEQVFADDFEGGGPPQHEVAGLVGDAEAALPENAWRTVGVLRNLV